MVNQFLPAKVVVAFKAAISTNGNLWKDRVDVRLTLGRRAEKRTVQGGAIGILPAEIISEGEFEVPMSTDVVETVHPPVNPDSISFWIYSIVTLGVLPVITISKINENKDADKGTLLFTAEVFEVVPGDKTGEDAEEKCIVKFVPTILTSFLRT